MVPLLTLYGDGRAVAADGERWVEGRVGELAVQEFLDDVRSVGLLYDDLVLRIGDGEGLPSITIRLDVDGRRFDHQLDLVRIERPAALRAFLQRAATTNLFELTAVFEPAVWVNCTDDTCRAGDAPDGDFSRPVLATETADELIATAATGEP